MPDTQPAHPACIKEDLFALGSTVYFIITGFEPFHELGDNDNEVQERYREGQFPDLAGVPFGEVIALCWRQEAKSAKMVLDLLRGPACETD